jgi:hypothetical protein
MVREQELVLTNIPLNITNCHTTRNKLGVESKTGAKKIGAPKRVVAIYNQNPRAAASFSL